MRLGLWNLDEMAEMTRLQIGNVSCVRQRRIPRALEQSCNLQQSVPSHCTGSTGR